jgi:hypothetical protein
MSDDETIKGARLMPACSLATHLQRNVLESVRRTVEKLHDLHVAHFLRWHDVLGAKGGVTTLHELPQIIGRDLMRTRKRRVSATTRIMLAFTLKTTSSMCVCSQEDRDKKRNNMTFDKKSKHLENEIA